MIFRLLEGNKESIANVANILQGEDKEFIVCDNDTKFGLCVEDNEYINCLDIICNKATKEDIKNLDIVAPDGKRISLEKTQLTYTNPRELKITPVFGAPVFGTSQKRIVNELAKDLKKAGFHAFSVGNYYRVVYVPQTEYVRALLEGSELCLLKRQNEIKAYSPDRGDELDKFALARENEKINDERNMY